MRRSHRVETRIGVRARSGGKCEARASKHCTGRSEQLHHRFPKSWGGPDTDANLLDVCAQCHRWIHKNENKAIKAGLLRYVKASA